VKKQYSGKHMEMDLGLKRPFKPSEDRPMPVFWIEEIRVYRSCDSTTMQCRYDLRPGLNVLWANPGPGGKALYERGVRGHAAGKTTFCRLLRHLLGEQNYGTGAFKQSLLNRFPTAILTAKVWLDGKSWIICKALGLSERRDLAFQGDDITQIFAPPESVIKSSDFSELLGNLVTKPLTARNLPYGSQLTWRYILPWLSRDQECRLAHLLEWRDSSTESNRPDMTNADACYIVRSVMGLISKEEEDAQEAHRELLKESKDLDTRVPLLKHEADRALMRVRQWARDNAIDGPLLFDVARRNLEAACARIDQDARLTDRRQAYDRSQKQYEEKQSDIAVAEESYDRERRLLDSDRSMLVTLQGNAHRDKAVEEMESEAPAPFGRCNVPMALAIKHGCSLAKSRRPDIESHKNMLTVEDDTKALAEAIEEMEAGLRERLAAIGRLKGELSTLEVARDQARVRYDDLRRELSESRGSLSEQIRDIDRAGQIYTESVNAVSNQAQMQQKLSESSRLQEEIRKRSDEKRERVNNLFDDLIKAVLGDDVQASFAAHAQSIDLKVECDGERTSAATETVKIIAFDLAAMLLSAEGFGHHPRFLIHDSPREADMANDIYQRFFLYMAKLEESYGDHAPNFQYIVTTTEPPPKHLQRKPWLFAKLDASKAEGRLLRVNL
jgi:hypothetical protein